MVVNPQLKDDVQVLKKCLGHSSILPVPALIYKFGRTRHLSLGRLINKSSSGILLLAKGGVFGNFCYSLSHMVSDLNSAQPREICFTG